MIQIVDGVRIYELREILDERAIPPKTLTHFDNVQFGKTTHGLAVQKAPHSGIPPSVIISPVRFDLDKGWFRADGTPLYAEALRRG